MRDCVCDAQSVLTVKAGDLFKRCNKEVPTTGGMNCKDFPSEGVSSFQSITDSTVQGQFVAKTINSPPVTRVRATRVATSVLEKAAWMSIGGVLMGIACIAQQKIQLYSASARGAKITDPPQTELP